MGGTGRPFWMLNYRPNARRRTRSSRDPDVEIRGNRNQAAAGHAKVTRRVSVRCDSIHRKTSPDNSMPNPLPEHRIRFEIQIRSAFEHAWSVTTHALSYKAGKVDWRVSRLASQMKAAVEQLDGLAMAFSQSLEPIVVHEWPEIAAKLTIQQLFVAGSLRKNKIPKEMEPANWTRFSGNVFSLLKSTKGFSWREMPNQVQYALGEIRAGIPMQCPPIACLSPCRYFSLF